MIRLHYWWSRLGRAEQIRLLLAELGLDWEEVDTEWASDAWRALQFDVLWFGAQPALVDGDFSLVQSGVILSYLARKHGLAPADLRASATADALAWSADDLRTEFARARRKDEGAFVAGPWPDRWLAALHHRLGAGPWLQGDTFTHADLAWWDALDQVTTLSPACAAAIPPPVEAWRARVAARPRVAAYLASARRPPAEE